MDMSGSMEGKKWASVCKNVEDFIDYLGPQDVVAGLVFNNQTTLLPNPTVFRPNRSVSTPKKIMPSPSQKSITTTPNKNMGSNY